MSYYIGIDEDVLEYNAFLMDMEDLAKEEEEREYWRNQLEEE